MPPSNVPQLEEEEESDVLKAWGKAGFPKAKQGTVMVTVNLIGTASGTVTGPGITCGNVCSITVNDTNSITLQAQATISTNSIFGGWAGDGCSGTGTCTVTPDGQNLKVTATFKKLGIVPPIFRTVTVTKDGTGTGTVTSSGITCGNDCSATINVASALTLTAAPSTGSTFGGWSGGICGGTGTCTVPPGGGDVTVTATFNGIIVPPIFRTVTVTKKGSGSGTVTSSGITCGNDCSATINVATALTLTAAPSADSTFGGWSGGTCGGTGTCTVPPGGGDVTVTATFTANPVRQLTVTRSGTGDGTVTGPGIACPTDCTHTVADGGTVIVTALASPGSTFLGWTGCTSTSGTQCTVTLTSDRTVAATFTKASGPLTTYADIKGILDSNCVACHGPSVQFGGVRVDTYLHALSNGSGIISQGVILDVMPPDAPLSGVMQDLLQSWAVGGFLESASSPAPRTLTVMRDGTGSGTVTSTPAGINCGVECANVYPDGTSVTLTAIPDNGSTFGSWGNCPAPSGNTCAVTLTAARTVTVTFEGGTSLPSKSHHDFNLDSKDDLIWRNTLTGATAIWLLNGAALGSAGFPGGVPLVWQIAGVGDVNGDGKADVIWRQSINGTVAVWLMNGLTVKAVGFPGRAPTAWRIQAVGDVDGDGHADLIWRDTSTGATAIWLMDGTAIGASSFPGGVPLVWQIAGAGDVDGDGKADIIWRQSTNGTVAVWLMNGGTVRTMGFPGSASPAFRIAGVGDVDGDGKADLVFHHTTAGTTAIWLMNGTALASSGFPGGVPAEWRVAQVGDVDGDGKADIIWRISPSGSVAVWLMNGFTISTVGFPGSAPTEWEIQ